MSSPDHGSRDLAMEALISPRVRVEDVVVAQRQTRTFESSLARSIQAESEQKVEQVAKKAEVVQQLTLEQLNRFQQQQEALASKTAEYLQQQYDNQVELNTKQAALSAQLEEQQKALAQQYQLMREAAETVGQQGRQIEDLKEEVLSPRGQSRWGWFARGTGQSGRERDGDEPMTGEDATTGRQEPTITVATGSNMPVPPVYRGSTKKEKKAFMDSYLIYKRRVTALNQGSYGRVFVMPLSACIEHRTLIRICMYELGRPESEITEEDWKAYFLAARRPEVQDHARLAQAMRSLAMSTTLPDAESRVMKLVTDFNEILDAQDMDDFPLEEPKMAVEFLCAALRPPAFKQTVVTELKRTIHKPTKKSVKVFVDWLRSRVSAFLIFESAIQQTTGGGGGQTHQQPRTGGVPRSTARFQPKGGATAGGTGAKPSAVGSSPATVGTKPQGTKKPATSAQLRQCFKCGDLTHGVFQCPLASAKEAKDLYDKNRKAAKPVGAVALMADQLRPSPPDTKADDKLGPLPCQVNRVLNAWAKPDSGAEVSVVTPRVLQELKAKGQWLQCRDLSQWESIRGITADPLVIKQEVKLDLRFDTINGGLTLKNLTCWVVSGGLPPGLGDILLSEGVMERLGYNAQALLDQARSVSDVYDMDEDAAPTGVRSVLAYAAATTTRPEPAPEEKELQPDEEQRCFPDIDVAQDREEARALEWEILESKLDEAAKLGCSATFRAELAKILFEYRDVFRIKLGRDPPVDMPPLKVTLKPDAVPVRCKARRYPPEHRAFMKRHVQELIDAGLCYRNPHSKWCSPPLIVKKVDPGDFRMTVDVRRVNAQTLRLTWPMPILEVITDYLTASELYFLLDFFKGYWQFLLSLECQELFSFLTDMGIFTPTRVLMGGSDSVAYCQATVQEMFEQYLYNGLLIWLDDLLGYEKSEEGLLTLLRGVLKVCATKGLKLNPAKCSFYLREAKWCGRVVSKSGVRHDPGRISALQALSAPVTGQDLQQFVCALGWMRMSIPGHNKLTQPLVDLMEAVYKAAGGRTRRQVSHVQLLEVGWTETHTECLQACKQALGNAVELAHVKQNYRLSVFTDASESHWGAVITQVPPDHVARMFSEQHHEPLMFLSGTFSGAARAWAIVEKEAYAIIATCQRADYLLHRPGGFTLYTDHRNLRFIFNPTSVVSSVPKYTADKLQRWALLLMAYEYEICDIAGDDNVWADLLSRWGSSLPKICAVRLVPYEYSPTLNDNFQWPTMAEVLTSQQRADRPADLELTADAQGIVRLPAGQIWIPAEAGSLQLRICIVGHFGVAGHRGLDTTVAAITSRFWWADIVSDVQYFVRRCLHCASVVGGPPLPRPLGEAMHAERPNELIHWDYLFMGASTGEDKYILVIKDDASKYVWFFAVPEATSDTTYTCLMDWFAAFGVCLSWVSDQGTHFKNAVIQSLQHALGAHHHFTTARCPWANGTVEVVMREALRCFRSLLSEWRLSTRDWPRLTKVVQLALNHTPAKSLGDHAPVTVMTGLPAMSPLDAISLPVPLEPTTLSALTSTREDVFGALRAALDNMHKSVAQASSAARAKGRKSARTAGMAMAQYDIGDYVLYADVWAHTRAKLRVKWCGPAQVVQAVSSWIFTVKNLLTGDEREVHASRLKFYSDSTLEVTEELLHHIAHNSEGHVVAELLASRYSEPAKRFELLVNWRGLSSAEDSWEPAATLLEDVPVLVKNFIRAHRRTAKTKKLASALALQALLNG